MCNSLTPSQTIILKLNNFFIVKGKENPRFRIQLTGTEIMCGQNRSVNIVRPLKVEADCS